MVCQWTPTKIFKCTCTHNSHLNAKWLQYMLKSAAKSPGQNPHERNVCTLNSLHKSKTGQLIRPILAFYPQGFQGKFLFSPAQVIQLCLQLSTVFYPDQGEETSLVSSQCVLNLLSNHACPWKCFWVPKVSEHQIQTLWLVPFCLWASAA